MLRNSKILLLITLLVFPQYYILVSPFRLTIIASLVLIGIFFMDMTVKGEVVLLGGATERLLLICIFFLLYVFFVDFTRNDAIDATRKFFGYGFIPFLLIPFQKRDKFHFEKVFNILLFISIYFAVMQLLGIRENLSTLFHGFGPIKSDNIAHYQMVHDGRVSGAVFSIVFFGEILAIAIILSYYKFLETQRWMWLVYITFLSYLLVKTQLRSAIYGLLPVLLIVDLITTTKKWDILKRFAIVTILFMTVLSLNLLYTRQPFLADRLLNPVDSSTIEKVLSNYYGSLGTLDESPLVGTRREDIKSTTQRKLSSNRRIFVDHDFQLTDHNQILYYLKYYGLIGVFFLALLYLSIHKYIMTECWDHRRVLLAILLFDFQHSMFHNNRLLSNSIIWIILGAFIARTTEHRRIIPHNDVQYNQIVNRQ